MTDYLKLHYPELNTAQLKSLERYIAEQTIKELEFLDTCPPALIYVGIADRIEKLQQEAGL